MLQNIFQKTYNNLFQLERTINANVFSLQNLAEQISDDSDIYLQVINTIELLIKYKNDVSNKLKDAKLQLDKYMQNCDHDYSFDSYDSHYNYYVCKKCGHEISE